MRKKTLRRLTAGTRRTGRGAGPQRKQERGAGEETWQMAGSSLLRKRTGEQAVELAGQMGTSRWRDVWSRWAVFFGGKSCGQRGFSYEDYPLSAAEWVRYGALGIGVCGLVAYTFYRSFLIFFLLLPFGAAYPLFHRKKLKEDRLFRLNQEFKEGIQILAANLSAGYSFENALANSVRELELVFGQKGMIRDEFALMVHQIQMNRPAEQVLFEFARRSGLEDVRNFAQVFNAARRSGGDLVAIISHTAGVIRDKAQVKEEIANMTAAKKLEQRIMNLIPFFLIVYIDKASPGFFDMMYGTVVGRILMTICLGVYGIAFWLSKRILDIPV